MTQVLAKPTAYTALTEKLVPLEDDRASTNARATRRPTR